MWNCLWLPRSTASHMQGQNLVYQDRYCRLKYRSRRVAWALPLMQWSPSRRANARAKPQASVKIVSPSGLVPVITRYPPQNPCTWTLTIRAGSGCARWGNGEGSRGSRIRAYSNVNPTTEKSACFRIHPDACLYILAVAHTMHQLIVLIRRHVKQRDRFSP